MVIVEYRAPHSAASMHVQGSPPLPDLVVRPYPAILRYYMNLQKFIVYASSYLVLDPRTGGRIHFLCCLYKTCTLRTHSVTSSLQCCINFGRNAKSSRILSLVSHWHVESSQCSWANSRAGMWWSRATKQHKSNFTSTKGRQPWVGNPNAYR